MNGRTAAAVLLAVLIPPASATLDVPTASLRVAATVGRSCLIDSGPLAFGDYDPVGRNAAAPLDAEGILTVICTRGTPSAVALDAGQHAAGQTRFMASGADRLGYELYQDQSHTVRWGDTPGDVLTLAPSDGSPRSVRVYGRVASNQDVAVGRYFDSIVATVVF
jgi:spore coat protein U-like protein